MVSDRTASRRAAFRIVGRVQGVGFRWWTRSVAEELGVVGWVRNVEDGSVEVEVEGPPDAVEALHRRLHEGPPASVVERVTERSASTGTLGHAFEIVRT